MSYTIKNKKSAAVDYGNIKLPASKSEANRMLIISALSEEGNIESINNLSNARDTETMVSLLSNFKNESTFNVLDAGTVMRFLTAFLAIRTDKTVVITGSDRMQQRPIGILAEALQEIGAEITYQVNEGYPPMIIKPFTNQSKSSIKIAGNVSSQFISALLMIAPALPNGLTLEVLPPVTSYPYIKLTTDLMEQHGINIQKPNYNTYQILAQPYNCRTHTVESDWSAASYWYSFIALSATGSAVFLEGLRKNSSQGDQIIQSLMVDFGVSTTFTANGALLTKEDRDLKSELSIDFKDCPDLAQTILCCSAVLQVDLTITGMESLKIKETDRIQALKNELLKFKTELIEIDEHHWELKTKGFSFNSEVVIDTYDDHRMAMCFAPLSCLGSIKIHSPEVVNKSYPDFWKHLEQVGVDITTN